MLSSIRNFFLSLFISMLVFGVSAYFLVGFIDRTINDTSDTQEATNDENPDNENPDGEPDEFREIDENEFTALILGIDNGQSQHDEKQECDTIILLNINAETKTFMLSSLPCDMKTETKGYILRLGAVYAEFDAQMMIQTVRAYTGIQADYLCVLDYKSIEKVFEILGDIEYNVPMDMYYNPNPDSDENDEETDAEPPKANNTGKIEIDYANEPIDLKAGRQRINGEQAVQLLRYRSYSNGNFDRIITQVDFIKEIIRQKITFANLANAKNIYTAVKKSVVETNMDEKDFEAYIETIFAVSNYEIKEVSYPGTVRNENGVSFFSPDIKSAIHRYHDYRKTK